MVKTIQFTHLAPREGSRYQQYFIKGRNVRAETLYRATVGQEPSTPEDVARDYDLPVDAVQEAVRYCLDNATLLQREREEDWAESQSRGLEAGALRPSGVRAVP
jgi:uncharacterized protein (DUF433 family)